MDRHVESKGSTRRYALAAALCLALVTGVAALFACSARIEVKREAVLKHAASVSAQWLGDAVKAVELWEVDMAGQRARISESETYRLFASDLYGLDSRVAGLINESESGAHAFEGQASVLSEEVPAIRRILLDFMNFNGLLDARLVNPGGQTILSAMAMPGPLDSGQKAAVAEALSGRRTVSLPVRIAAGGLVRDVFEPVFDIEDPAKPVAVFMARHPVLSSISQFLARPKPEDLAIACMLQHTDKAWEVLLADGPVPVVAAIGAELEKASGSLPFALREAVCGHGSVYSASAVVPGRAWSMVLEIPASVIERRLFYAELPVWAVGILAWAAVQLFAALLWWVGVGRQQRAVNEELRRLHTLVSRQKELLDRVNVSLDIGLFMADVKGQIHVCNRAFGKFVGRQESELEGQSLFSCLPHDIAMGLLDHIRKVALGNVPDVYEVSMEKDGKSHLFRVSLYPFLDSAEESLRSSIRGAVVGVKDITEFRRRSERARRQQESLIEAFIRAEESVDPYLAGRSRRMASLGALLAESLGLDEDSRSTILAASRLSQLGKLFIPRELLTRKGGFTPEELAAVREAPEHAWRLLENIDFGLPVPRTVYEMYERLDGSGYPRGLKDGEILYEARVLAVLNAFCAMVSARSYREGMSVEQAVAELDGSAAFDQEVVDHLKKVLETPEGILAVHAKA